MTDVNNLSLAELDPEVAAAMAGELGRQRDTLEMIASENFVPQAVLEAQGSKLARPIICRICALLLMRPH